MLHLTLLDFYLLVLSLLLFLVIIILIIFCFVLELQDLNEQ
ncbi:ORF7b [Severe acute respiratory syndrome-related coronavirus]|uniref:Accessory protein 7b n=1 Tax=Severe acute respiratory syndrome coronavirus TaxID=694009 RepID=A0A3Q8AV63_SARS|nr:ORF7b [Severe acute respiratory syndrome-related coronavirus]